MKELLEVFKIDITETIKKFPLYNFEDFNFEFNHFQNEDYQNEEWKQIGNLHYSISNYGRIRNDKNKQFKAPRFHRWLFQIDLYENGKRYTVGIPRLVANYFIREIKNTERVIHKDGEYKNNYYENLEIVSK